MSIIRNISNNNSINPDYFMVSTGISDSDFNNLADILSKIQCNSKIR